LIRILRGIGISAVVLLLLGFGFVQLQQHLLRHHAERLLSDFQSIRLHQSTWADAQILMTRWGRWGHYDGTCTSADCEYTITLSDPVLRLHPTTNTGWQIRLLLARVYMFLQGDPTTLRVRFKVQDGIVWRSSVWLNIFPPPAMKDHEDGYALLLSARASDSLYAKPGGPWILGNDDQLAEHPDYKVGRPGGCTGCLREEVTFTPYISPDELKRLTAYDLSCLTRFHRCLNLPDVLPAAREWHLYPTTEPAYQVPPPPTTQLPCAIPVFAHARDADSIVAVEVLSSRNTKEPGNVDPTKLRDAQRTQVRILQTLKGVIPLAPGSLSEFDPWAGDDNFPWQAPQRLDPGKQYILFSSEEAPPTSFCGVVEDAPQVRQQIDQGMAQNDHLRRPDESVNLFW
jgi:hypothetical protein